MYKIFAKDKCVCLVDNKGLFVEKNGAKLVDYINSAQLLKEYEVFMQEDKLSELYFFSSDLQTLWDKYTGLFKPIGAAGGVVKNNKNELLLIFRHQRWDLPKGKIEPGEEVKHAAIREVQEECGVQKIAIVKGLPVTHHTYELKGKHVIKKTHWFEMTYTGTSEKLVPQLEEDITDVRWMNKEQLHEAMKNTYPLIKSVLGSYI